jgi:hypothetical protein
LLSSFAPTELGPTSGSAWLDWAKFYSHSWLKQSIFAGVNLGANRRSQLPIGKTRKFAVAHPEITCFPLTMVAPLLDVP